MSIRRAIVAATALTVLSLAAAPALAQPPADSLRRPFRGLFGASQDPDAPHSLMLSGSAFAAYDDNVIAGLADRRTSTPWLQRSGTYQGANVGLNYAFTKGGNRFDFRGHLAGRLNYYRRGASSAVHPSNQGDVSFGARLTRTLSFSARQSVSYTSNYNPSLTPRVDEDLGHDIGLADDDVLDIFKLRALRTASSLGLAQAFGRYTSLSANYHYRSMYLLDDDVPNSRFHDYGSHSGTVNLRHSRPVSRHASLQLGYGVRVSDRRSGTGEPQVMHNVDAGINYGRALSFSRRTSFSFSTGSAVAVRERGAVPDGDPRTRIRLTGNAALMHEIGRTWSARVTYSRGFRTQDGFDGLYFTDAINAGIGGLITRRLSFSAATAWADSSIENRGGHRGQSANAQLQYALAGFVALYARYNYYHYSYSDNLPLDERFPRRLDRHGVRVGVTASVPLLR